MTTIPLEACKSKAKQDLQPSQNLLHDIRRNRDSPNNAISRSDLALGCRAGPVDSLDFEVDGLRLPQLQNYDTRCTDRGRNRCSGNLLRAVICEYLLSCTQRCSTSTSTLKLLGGSIHAPVDM